MIVGIHHIAIGVSDIDRALAFYGEVLGFEVLSRSEWDGDNEAADRVIGLGRTSAKAAMLRAGNAYVELWQYAQPEPADREPLRACDHGYPHFALQVRDIDAEYRRLVAAGMEFVGEPEDFGHSSAIYGRDPFGNLIEIYEIRRADLPQIVVPG